MADVSNRRRGNSYGYDRYTHDYGRTSYVDGNTVRQLNAVPKRREETTPRRAPKRYPVKKPVKMSGIDGVSFVFMVCALCVVVFVAFTYIRTQNQVREMKSEIVSLQTEIEKQKEENDIKYNQILASVDLSDIYKRATKKLKMVMADSNKMYTYKSKKGDMVKQYADIPGATSSE